jgi:hypothetical protein
MEIRTTISFLVGICKRAAGVGTVLLLLTSCCNCLRDVKDLEWAAPSQPTTVPDFRWTPIKDFGPSNVVLWKSSTAVAGRTYLTGWYAAGEPPGYVPTGVIAKLEKGIDTQFASPFRQLVWSVAEDPTRQLIAYAVTDGVLIKQGSSKAFKRYVAPASTPMARVQFMRLTSTGQIHLLVRHRAPNAEGRFNVLGPWTYEIFDPASEQWAPSRVLHECGFVRPDGFHIPELRIFDINDQGAALIGTCPQGFLLRDDKGNFKVVKAAGTFSYPFGHFNTAGDLLVLFGANYPKTEIEVRLVSDFTLKRRTVLDAPVAHVARLLNDDAILETLDPNANSTLYRLDPFRETVVQKLPSPRPRLRLLGALPFSDAHFVLMFSGVGSPLIAMETMDGGKTWTERGL